MANPIARRSDATTPEHEGSRRFLRWEYSLTGRGFSLSLGVHVLTLDPPELPEIQALAESGEAGRTDGPRHRALGPGRPGGKPERGPTG